MNASAPNAVAVRMTGVSKSFGGIRALDNVDLSFHNGQIHALLGGNGAGKSTLLKILNGVYTPDAGSKIEVGGVSLTENTPEAARKAGIAMIFQEMSLVPTLSVAQNIFLTRERRDGLGLIDDAKAERQARELFSELEIDIDPRLLVSELSAGQQQLTEIIKAMSQQPSILILDEPTTALSSIETDRLFSFVVRLKAKGVAIVYVSHRMDEIFKIADVATILRDGRHVMTAPISEFTLQTMIEHIVGRSAAGFHDFERQTALGEPLVELRGVSGTRRPQNTVDLVVHRGEVVGVAGLLGSGRSSMVRVLCGIDPLAAGEIRIKGQLVSIKSPRDAIRHGIALIPEDRRRQGFVAAHSVAENIHLPVLDKLSKFSWMLNDKAKQHADGLIKRLRVKTASADSAISTLSGGNAQKVVIAKWLGNNPDVLVLDEPTAGIDIGSKGEIVALIRELAKQGKAVLILSSELAELLAASDRIVVMSNGQLVRDIPGSELEEVMAPASEPAERQLLAERYLQMALQNRAQQYAKTFSTGPNGETPELSVNVKLSDEELARIRAMQAKAAIVMHYVGNDWSRAQVEGLKAQFAVMGIEVVAVSDAGFRAEQQVKDIEAALALNPQIIVSIPTDPVATAAAYRHAAERGVQLIYMDNVPKGHVAGRDYVSAVSSDNHGNGVASAQLMAKALGGQGEIGLVFHAADFFVTRQRYEAFKQTMAEQYPGIRIVAEQGISGPDFAAQARLAAQAMLAAHPQLKGIWAVWDVPAEGVIAAARAAARPDLVVTTIDLGQEVAADMARGGNVRGVAAQRVYDQGVIEALLAGYGLLGKAAPAFVALPALPVDKDNVRDAWQIVYRHNAPNFEHITPQGDFS
ncbi:ATP-binding cassette domain-containing protein [Rhodoferax sp.]|uniref:ATP-binding cassette domain-containing protein n=1 Tax=Rhodoferax sp. TaxID=50421 RepID=UPI0025D73C92|nr:ATP-binding cassette domain-containing protein [Rhodoferax sp.]